MTIDEARELIDSYLRLKALRARVTIQYNDVRCCDCTAVIGCKEGVNSPGCIKRRKIEA